MAKDLLIQGGRVIDPSTHTDKVLDVLVVDGKIAKLSEGIEPEGHMEVLDAKGKIVMPGFIDMHVHLREPGFEYKEDIETGTKAAAMGGFTAVACMPNTEPACDNDSVVTRILERARKTACVRVYPIGAVTKNRAGKELAELGEMRAAGAVAFSDDGSPVATAETLRCALEYLKSFDAVLIDHPEDMSLSDRGQINYGLVSTVSGLRGIPRESEEIAVARDLLIARLTRGRLHLAHLSTEGSISLVRRARARGINVTCEVTPHHLILTDEIVLEAGYDTNTKVNPPLRSQDDVDALREALSDGTIDVIATDHAPHHIDDKWVEYDYADFGISGLETAVGLIIDKLVLPGVIDWMKMAELMSLNPARILGVPGGTLKVDAAADITVIDSDCEHSIVPRNFESKGRNSPFMGWRLTGAPYGTIVGGKAVMYDGRMML